MFLFISNYPDEEGEKDGMMQRVMAVDRRFADRERAYLGISFFGHARRSKETLSDRLTVHRVNFFLHFLFIIRIALDSRGVYVHSVHNGLRALPLYLHGNVVTDLHGLFPEELAYYGKRVAALVYGVIERIAVRCSRSLIVVSDAMAEHLRGKYGGFKSRIYTVPIFDDFPIGRRDSGGADTPLVAIYSGGSQKWQNIELMMESMAGVRDRCSFVIMTPDLPYFERKITEYGLEEMTELLSVPKNAVYGHYLRADLGFVLRDDSPVNRAACPTKLVEYLACGVIPIVLEPGIGDFASRGYACLSLERFVKGNFPPRQELEGMRINNYRVITGMRDSAAETMGKVIADFTANESGYGATT